MKCDKTWDGGCYCIVTRRHRDTDHVCQAGYVDEDHYKIEEAPSESV